MLVSTVKIRNIKNIKTLSILLHMWLHSLQLSTIAKKLLKPYLDEAKQCIQDGVVTDPDLLDAAMIFGTGFAGNF